MDAHTHTHIHTHTQLPGEPDETDKTATEGLSDADELGSRQAPPWQRLLEPLARLAAPPKEDDPDARTADFTQAHEVDPGLFVPPAHRERFMHAGLRQRGAPVAFYAAKVLLALGLPLLAWMGMGLAARHRIRCTGCRNSAGQLTAGSATAGPMAAAADGSTPAGVVRGLP